MAVHTSVRCILLIIPLAAISLLYTLPTERSITNETAFEGICCLSEWIIQAKTLSRISANAQRLVTVPAWFVYNSEKKTPQTCCANALLKIRQYAEALC